MCVGELFIKPSSRDEFQIARHDTCCKYKVIPSRLPILSKISYAHGEIFMMIVPSFWMGGSLGSLRDYYEC